MCVCAIGGYCIVMPTASTIRFTPSTYSVNESDRKVNCTLHHSNPSSIEINLTVISRSITASGE